MLDFLTTYYFLVFYGITLVASIISYPKYYDTVLKYFPILITYTLLCELLGVLIRDSENFQIFYGQDYSNHNALIYNVFDIVFYLYFFYVYYKVISKSKSRKFIILGVCSFVIISLINPFFQDIRILPQSYAILIGSIFLIGSILCYFYELRLRKRILKSNRNLLFWISIGLLIFYSPYPILISDWFWDARTYKKYHLSDIHLALIALMYLCFLIGFLRMRKTKVNKKEKNWQ